MSQAAALASAQDLKTALLDNGVRAVSIELQQGVAGSGWGIAPFRRGLGHHIASRPSQGRTPGLALVKRGRADLAGPLCNGYGGYDLVARIITMAWANHPGAGGPWPVPGWGTVPVNNGRPYIFGWEFEGGYEPYTDEMHDFMARCGAGTLDWLGSAPLTCWDEHKGWAGPRKPDRIGYTTASGRSRIAAVRGTTAPTPAPFPVGEDMRLVAIPSKAVYKVTEYDVSLEPGIYRMGSIAKGWNVAVTQVSLEEFLDIKADVDERRARLLTDIAKAAGGDVDEELIASMTLAKLIPAVIEAVAGKTGASREEIAELLRGITLKAS